MSDAVLITLIVCATIVVLTFIVLAARGDDAPSTLSYPERLPQMPQWVTKTQVRPVRPEPVADETDPTGEAAPTDRS